MILHSSDVRNKLRVYIDFVILLYSLLPHHDSRSNGLKSEKQVKLLQYMGCKVVLVAIIPMGLKVSFNPSAKTGV